jgi:hypothetical protein
MKHSLVLVPGLVLEKAVGVRGLAPFCGRKFEPPDVGCCRRIEDEDEDDQNS